VLDSILSFITTHWDWFSLGLLALAAVANALSKHYSTHSGFAKAALWVSEMASLLRSKGAPGNSLPGLLARLKLPLQSCPPNGDHEPPSAPLGVCLILAAAVAASSCATMSPTEKLEKIGQAATSASSLAEPGFRSACGSIAASCVVRGARSPADCPAWGTCMKARRLVNAAIQAAHAAVIEGLTLAAIGDKAGALDKLDAAAKALADAYKLLRESGALTMIGDMIKSLADEPPPESAPAPPPPAEGKTIREVL
jgi:hypothetical protein